MFPKLSTALLILTAAASVSAHGALVAVTGSNGVNGQGFGVVDSTPRDGTRRNPFQTDTSIIRDKEIASGDAGPCGRTLAGGVNDMGAQMEAAASAGLPSAAEDGTVTMTIHQVNGDGAGPYECGVSADASGKSFAAMKVVTNVPGENSRSNAKAQDFALVAQMPAGTTCTGGPNGDACVVRCRNAARAGPFGGCTAVTNAQPAANAKREVTVAEAEAALAEDLERRAAYPRTEPRRASVSLIIHVRPPAHLLDRADLLPPTPPTLNDFFRLDWVNHPDSVAELLYIRREGRDGKGADSHVAFPGGRSEEGDEGALYTAMRQTWEEIGLDLADNEWTCVGQLDDREITTSLGKRLLMILSPFVFLHLSPHPPHIDIQEDSQTTVHAIPIGILPPFNKNPKTTFVEVDIASRLAPRNSFARVFVRSLIGNMKFGAVLLPPRTAIAESPSSLTQKQDLKLWGLTLGMTLDLVQNMLEKMNARPLAPTAASAVFLGEGAASMTSIFPRFSIPDVNLWIWVFGKRYRDVIRAWEASMSQSGTNDRRINWSGSALNAFYGAVRRALVVVIILRALGLLGALAGLAWWLLRGR